VENAVFVLKWVVGLHRMPLGLLLYV